MGNGECVCGLGYHNFRTGLSFREVRRLMWSDSSDSTTWRHKGRRQVLGYWRQLKLDMWAAHCAECEHYESQYPEEFAAYYGRAA